MTYAVRLSPVLQRALTLAVYKRSFIRCFFAVRRDVEQNSIKSSMENRIESYSGKFDNSRSTGFKIAENPQKRLYILKINARQTREKSQSNHCS